MSVEKSSGTIHTTNHFELKEKNNESNGNRESINSI